MKKLTQVMLAAGLVSTAALAQAQESPISANVALTSDYIFRGISQTEGGPAVQGGFDYEHDSGLYAGVWASSITFDDSIELDYYGGYAGELTEDIGFDVGFIHYDYPGAGDDDFQEVYLGLSYADFGASVAYSDDFFGGTGNALYYALDYGVEIAENISLGLHYGYSDFDEVQFGDEDSYSDYGVSLSTSYAGVDLSLGWSDTDLGSSDCGADCEGTAVFTIAKSL